MTNASMNNEAPLCELTMINQPSDNTLSSRVFIEQIEYYHKPFLKLLFSDQTVMQNFEDGVIKTEHFESRMGAKFKEWLRKQTNGEMCWWMIRTRGTKGIGAIGTSKNTQTKVINVVMLFKPEIQNKLLAGEAVLMLAKYYEAMAKEISPDFLEKFYEYELVVSASMSDDQSQDMMNGLGFVPFEQQKQNGRLKRVYYKSKCGDFLRNDLFQRRTKATKPLELLGSHPHYRLPSRLDLHQYTKAPKSIAKFPYRGILQFQFDEKWKHEKQINSLPALGCNKQHSVGTASLFADKSMNISWQDCYLAVYICKSDRSVVYQAKRNKRDGFPLVFSQFGLKQRSGGEYMAEIKLQPKSQALDENGKHIPVFCVVELWHQLVKLDQIESDPFYTHSEDRRKKATSSSTTTTKSATKKSSPIVQSSQSNTTSNTNSLLSTPNTPTSSSTPTYSYTPPYTYYYPTYYEQKYSHMTNPMSPSDPYLQQSTVAAARQTPHSASSSDPYCYQADSYHHYAMNYPCNSPPTHSNSHMLNHQWPIRSPQMQATTTTTTTTTNSMQYPGVETTILPAIKEELSKGEQPLKEEPSDAADQFVLPSAKLLLRQVDNMVYDYPYQSYFPRSL